MTTVTTCCPSCGRRVDWSWTEAFDKFGFDDGDGLVMTDVVVSALRNEGFVVKALPWGLHNVTIVDIWRKGLSIIPSNVRVGYDDPRQYLPQDVVELLDKTFPAGEEITI